MLSPDETIIVNIRPPNHFELARHPSWECCLAWRAVPWDLGCCILALKRNPTASALSCQSVHRRSRPLSILRVPRISALCNGRPQSGLTIKSQTEKSTGVTASQERNRRALAACLLCFFDHLVETLAAALRTNLRWPS